MKACLLLMQILALKTYFFSKSSSLKHFPLMLMFFCLNVLEAFFKSLFKMMCNMRKLYQIMYVFIIKSHITSLLTKNITKLFSAGVEMSGEKIAIDGWKIDVQLMFMLNIRVTSKIIYVSINEKCKSWNYRILSQILCCFISERNRWISCFADSHDFIMFYDSLRYAIIEANERMNERSKQKISIAQAPPWYSFCNLKLPKDHSTDNDNWYHPICINRRLNQAFISLLNSIKLDFTPNTIFSSKTKAVNKKRIRRNFHSISL